MFVCLLNRNLYPIKGKLRFNTGSLFDYLEFKNKLSHKKTGVLQYAENKGADQSCYSKG